MRRTGDMYTIKLNGKTLDWFQADEKGSSVYTTGYDTHDAHWDAITATTAINDALLAMGITADMDRNWLMSEDTNQPYDELVYDIKTE